MNRHKLFLAASAASVLLAFAARLAPAAELAAERLETKLVPGPVNVSVLLPDGYAESKETYPLLLWLHGGNGDNGFLKGLKPAFEAMWAAGEAPKMVIATPDAGRSFYLDYRDGSQKWETFITGELLDHLRQKYRVSKGPKGTFIGGISMGGMGSLRMAFKRTDLFGAVVAMEPGIEPAFEWKDVKEEDKFYRAPELMEEKFGKPIDGAYWAANNPATIARDNAPRILASGLAIYIEVGSEDMLGLDRGAEFLHRLLYDRGVKHEFRYVLGGDHVGATLRPRTRDAISFLDRVVNPPGPDRAANIARRQFERMKRGGGRE